MALAENGHPRIGHWPDLLTLIPHLQVVDLGKRQTPGAARQPDRASDAEGALDGPGRAEHSTDGRPPDPRSLNFPTRFKTQ